MRQDRRGGSAGESAFQEKTTRSLGVNVKGGCRDHESGHYGFETRKVIDSGFGKKGGGEGKTHRKPGRPEGGLTRKDWEGQFREISLRGEKKKKKPTIYTEVARESCGDSLPGREVGSIGERPRSARYTSQERPKIGLISREKVGENGKTEMAIVLGGWWEIWIKKKEMEQYSSHRFQGGWAKKTCHQVATDHKEASEAGGCGSKSRT